MTQTTHTFQAETQQLLDILIHSLYTERDIFLRELISNASDALNRLQFEQLTNENILDPDADLKITIKVDKDAKTITISDTGIGMTADEMIENLGTIAKSGAKNFIQALKDKPEGTTAQDIIGQFGVGFYSVFMAADKVRVISRSADPDAEAAVWEADGGTSYTIESSDKANRGTDIIIYVKEEAEEYLTDWKIKDIVRRHSNYVAFPIYVGDDEEPTNSQTAIWRKDPKEIEDEEYNNFYKMLTMDFNDPLHRIHMRADVPMQFFALLFIPSDNQPGMLNLRNEPGLKLYARKVLIQENSKDLLPEYLQFVEGVVDSEDLPLSVSRESVQATRIMANLKNTLTKKVLSELKRMVTKDRDTYLDIYAEFGRYLKQGMVVAPQDKESLEPLLFFNSTHDDNEDNWYSLSEYVERMVDGQDEIYYVVADDIISARRSPHLDAFRQRGIEVFYFTDPVDSMVPMGLTEYNGHKLRSVDESDIDLKDVGEIQETEEQLEEPLAEDTFQTLRERFTAILGERVQEVRDSKTLVGSPARLVSDDSSSNRYMYRINRLLDREYELPVKTLELNPRHPLMHNLSNILASDKSNPLVDVVIEQVFENALLQDGIHPDPAGMADRLTKLMQAATGSKDVDFSHVMPVDDDDDPIEEITIDAE